MSRALYACRYCGHATYLPARVCNAHVELLELEVDAMVAQYLDSEVMQAALLPREVAPTTMGTEG